MTTFKLQVNGKPHTVDVDADTPLLYVLRNDLKLNGAKFGCGLGQCGSCTVMLDKEPVMSCLVPVSMVGARAVRTVESGGTRWVPSSVLQQAFIDEQVTALAAYLRRYGAQAEPWPSLEKSVEDAVKNTRKP